MAWEVAFLTSFRRWWYCLSRDKTIYKFYKWVCELEAWEHSSIGKHSTHPDDCAAPLFSKHSRLLYSFSRNAKVYGGDWVGSPPAYGCSWWSITPGVAFSYIPGVWMLLLLFSCWVVSDSLPPHGLQHARLPCPPLSPAVCPSSRALNLWC